MVAQVVECVEWYGEDLGSSLVYVISELFLLFNYFACRHCCGIQNYKAWCA